MHGDRDWGAVRTDLARNDAEVQRLEVKLAGRGCSNGALPKVRRLQTAREFVTGQACRCGQCERFDGLEGRRRSGARLVLEERARRVERHGVKSVVRACRGLPSDHPPAGHRLVGHGGTLDGLAGGRPTDLELARTQVPNPACIGRPKEAAHHALVIIGETS